MALPGKKKFCKQHQIMYQGFSLLTANREVWDHEAVARIAKRLNKTPAQVILRFATLIGITPLTGTTDKKHMKQDLQIFDFDLSVEEINEIL